MQQKKTSDSGKRSGLGATMRLGKREVWSLAPFFGDLYVKKMPGRLIVSTRHRVRYFLLFQAQQLPLFGIRPLKDFSSLYGARVCTAGALPLPCPLQNAGIE